MIQRILSLVWKEILIVLRDRNVRFIILLPPVIELFVFSFAATLEVKNVQIGILNRDRGEKSIELLQRFHGSKVFSHIVYLKGTEDIAPFIDNQKGVMVLSIDEQFSQNLDTKKNATVQMILDGRKSNTAQIVTGYATAIINKFNQDFAQQAGFGLPRATLISRVWFNPNTLYYWHNIPCFIALMSMLCCLIVTTQSIAREREVGTFDQLVVSPLKPFEILIGKVIPGVMIGIFQGMFLLCVGVFALQAPFTGSILAFILSLFVFVSATSGIGLFISSLCVTQQQTMFGTFIFMTSTTILSGFSTPIENMPQALQLITYILPLKYMLIISKGIFLKAMPIGVILKNVWPMCLIAVITILTAHLSLRRRIQ